jgi:hypothetical protein
MMPAVYPLPGEGTPSAGKLKEELVMQTALKNRNPHDIETMLRQISKTRRILMLVAAVIAAYAILPSTALASCDHRIAGGGLAVMPAFSGIGNLATANAPSKGSGPASIVGLWHVLFTSDGQPFDEGYDMWLSDGVEILNDTAPPQPANGAGTVCLGVYKKIGPRTYKLKHPFWGFDENSNLSGRGMISEVVVVDPGGNSYQGAFTFQVYDLDNNLVFEAKGTLKAKRITAD